MIYLFSTIQYKINKEQIFMKRFLTIVSFMFLYTASFWAQTHGTGLKPDTAAYRRTKVIPTYSGEKYANIPWAVSLRKYCPTPRDQFETSTCVGWAVGYGALTICHAIQDSITDLVKLNERAHSAMFLYNSIKTQKTHNCSEGVWFDEAFDTLKTNGNCTVRMMSNDTINCSHDTIPYRAKEEAKNYKIKDFAVVFDLDMPGQERIKKVCQMIAAQNPVIIGFRMTDSFYNIKTQKIWSPPIDDKELEGFHAMVIVGYNRKDRTFEVMNSWGDKWGDGGFITFSFETFEKHVKFAYIITPNDKVPISGELNCQKQMDTTLWDIKTKFNKERQVYELASPASAAGSIFQLTCLNVKKGKYVYAFSVDALGKTVVHYPFAPNDYSAIASYDAQIRIPATELGIEISKKGENAFIVLYSDSLIGDFDKRVKEMERHPKQSIQNKLKKAFGHLLINSDDIKYDSNVMKLNSLAKYGQGSVAPLILMIEG